MDHGNPETLKALLFNFYRLFATVLFAPLVNHPLHSRVLQKTPEFCSVLYFPCMDIMKNGAKKAAFKGKYQKGDYC